LKTAAAFVAWATTLALMTPCAHAVGDETLEFEGRWTVTLQPPTGPGRQAELVLANYGGQWKERATKAGRLAACKPGKPFPVTVQKSVSTELEFSVWSAAVSPGCSNLSITVAPKGPKTLQGTGPDGTTVTMTRR
jgi:hypothetical protein